MKVRQFILIDDDHLSNNLSRLYIKQTLPDMKIVVFNFPEIAMSYLETDFFKHDSSDAILLLDINMPTMNGWDFLDKYNELDKKIKDQISVYILSSSIDLRDKDKAANTKYVRGYLEKPLEVKVIKELYEANG